MSAQTPPRPLDGLMILVVDDHRDTVDMLREYLYSAGATVIGADGARAALAFAETHVLDVVLVDIRMPGEDGHWFLRQLRASRTVRTAQVPVFAITGERHSSTRGSRDSRRSHADLADGPSVLDVGRRSTSATGDPRATYR